MDIYKMLSEINVELNRRRDKCGPTDGAAGRAAGRELSLAITALEDAWTHANAATYYKGGTYKRANADLIHPEAWH